jgi:tetratricopeptide (TPR) repeat protein
MPNNGPPLPSAAEAQQMLSVALAEAIKPQHDCATVVNPKTRLAYALVATPPAEMKKNLDAWTGFARCAEKQKYFRLMEDVGLRMVAADEKLGHPELLARAELGLEEYQMAAKVLDAAAKNNPHDANVALTAAKVLCRINKWKECVKYANSSIKESAKLDAEEKKQVQNRAYKYLARADLHLGKFADAEKAINQSTTLGGDAAELAEVKNNLVPAKLFKSLVEVISQPELPLGTYHLYGKVPGVGPLAMVELSNLDKADKQFKVEVGIDGVTQRTTQTVVVPKGQGKAFAFSPPLATGFNASSVRAAQSSQLAVKVTAITAAGEKVIFDQSLPIDLQPQDFLPLAAFSGKDAEHSTRAFVGAWITPNSKTVDSFLTKAKARATHATFSGMQSDTVTQVKALYDELQAEGFSYVMDPDVLANDAVGQRTRLPSEVLGSTNAQCLEGTVLYATLMEAIGLHPVVVFVPGHAFVGWEPSPKDQKPPTGYYFLETTATHTAKFEDAVVYAMGEFADHFKKKDVTVLDITKLRKLGIAPQPVE